MIQIRTILLTSGQGENVVKTFVKRIYANKQTRKIKITLAVNLVNELQWSQSLFKLESHHVCRHGQAKKNH